LLSEVGLGQRLDHKPGELSGGERQRAAIARALINGPDCILADEPTGNLDRKNAEMALELIMQLNQSYQTALIMVTHDLHIAERLGTVYVLEDGVLQLQ
jgi:lipoprotein-releasing system ATP-binding protein